MRLRVFVLVAALAALFCVPVRAQVVWTVDDVADPVPVTGTLTLRQAITGANAMPGLTHIVRFALPGIGVQLIQPLFALPPITVDNVWIDGFSQSGAIPGLQPPSTAVILVQLDGGLAGLCHGLTLLSSHNTIEGLAVTNFAYDGIRVQGTPPPGTNSNVIRGNFVGIDASGAVGMGNGGQPGSIWAGIDVLCTPGPLTLCQNNIVQSNLVSKNLRCGIQISSCPPSDCSFNQVLQNWIGTDIGGMVPLGNLGSGIVLAEGTHDNIVDDNVVAANGANGVDITGNDFTIPPANTLHNQFNRNLIGVAFDGVTPLGNGARGVSLGIFEFNSYFAGFCPENLFANNVVANNGLTGIGVWENQQTPANADGNTFTANSLHDNGGLSVDLDEDGPTLNDPGDLDSGADQCLNHPDIMTAGWLYGPTTITGTAPPLAQVEVYRGRVDPRGDVEADVLVATTTADALGNWLVTANGLVTGDLVTALSLDWRYGLYADTSEASPALTVQSLTGAWDPGGEFGIAVVGPNPSGGAAVFACRLDRPGSANLRLYDLAGRLVRELPAGEEAGYGRLVDWDGRDERGRDVPAGVYLAWLTAPGRQAGCRVVILR